MQNHPQSLYIYIILLVSNLICFVHLKDVELAVIIRHDTSLDFATTNLKFSQNGNHTQTKSEVCSEHE